MIHSWPSGVLSECLAQMGDLYRKIALLDHQPGPARLNQGVFSNRATVGYQAAP